MELQVIVPIGPNDKYDWVKRCLDSVIKTNSKITVYNNSEREDLTKLVNNYNVEHVIDKRLPKVNMALLRNKMLSLAITEYPVLVDSDVVMPSDGPQKLVKTAKEEKLDMTWMHYAYTEKDLLKPTSTLENNPNLGCASLRVKAVKEIGMFDERYERDEDIWIYAKLLKAGYKAKPINYRCLHLNLSHKRDSLRKSLAEAKRNFRRSVYDAQLLFDGLAPRAMLTSYAYYWGYYITAIIGIVYYPLFLLYLPIIATGLYYYKSGREMFYNLIPGLSLAISSPYGVVKALYRKTKKDLNF
ncbi:glycosyl transferase family 2 [Sulfolobales archaeon HS-7]|nr:glycosyl transferase family 2 [Sulfolobales archaeon HS-7]